MNFLLQFKKMKKILPLKQDFFHLRLIPEAANSIIPINGRK